MSWLDTVQTCGILLVLVFQMCGAFYGMDTRSMVLDIITRRPGR